MLFFHDSSKPGIINFKEKQKIVIKLINRGLLHYMLRKLLFAPAYNVVNIDFFFPRKAKTLTYDLLAFLRFESTSLKDGRYRVLIFTLW